MNRIRAGQKARAATDAGTPTSALDSRAFANPVAPPSTNRPLWLLATGSLVIWIPVLPWTQREQMNRYAVEQLLESGEVNRAIARMSAHEPGDFPPQWEPPPRPEHGDLAWAEPPVVKIVRAVRAERPKPWVAQRFVDKVDLRLQGLFFGRLGSWDLLLISGQHPDPEYRFIPERLRKKYGIEDVDGRREKLELLEFLFEFHHDMDPELRTALEGLHASLLDPSKDPAQ